MIIHADYLMDSGVLKIIKKTNSFEFTNPGILKLPLEDIYRGGNSKSRNPHMQTMLRLVGFGDNAGSGFPTILNTWKQAGWVKPKLLEDTNLNQVSLILKMINRNADNNGNLNQNNERSLSEVLSEVLSKKNYDKTSLIIKVLDEKGEITPEEAKLICEKSPATIRRYFKLLIATGYVIAEGNTNNIVYKVVKK